MMLIIGRIGIMWHKRVYVYAKMNNGCKKGRTVMKRFREKLACVLSFETEKLGKMNKKTGSKENDGVVGSSGVDGINETGDN